MAQKCLSLLKKRSTRPIAMLMRADNGVDHRVWPPTWPSAGQEIIDPIPLIVA
jgi:hypothetical protein